MGNISEEKRVEKWIGMLIYSYVEYQVTCDDVYIGKDDDWGDVILVNLRAKGEDGIWNKFKEEITFLELKIGDKTLTLHSSIAKPQGNGRIIMSYQRMILR